MKFLTFSKSAFAVTAVLSVALAAACGEELAGAPAPAQADAAPPPATTVPLPPATTSEPPAEKKCAPTCKTDSDCTNSCPALAGGIQCCDLETSLCFVSKTAACPKPTQPTDAGSQTPTY
jgi:hypothetical protein